MLPFMSVVNSAKGQVSGLTESKSMAKIKRVVLYKHGVGHFERQARVEGDAGIKLAFRAEEMNDVLKSLTVHDQDGGCLLYTSDAADE